MKFVTAFSLAGMILAASPSAHAQPTFDEVEITSQQVAPGISVLFGSGGNIGVSHGKDATILIDDQYAPLSEKIMATIAALGVDPVSFVVNTHWHFDHTGGNENFGEAGATIFAHENVRRRLVEGGNIFGREIAPAPPAALPVVTFEHGVTFHQNGDTIDVLFTGGGHTDGDSIVRWREDNVVHMGDLYFNTGGFPFIDTSSGGNIMTAIESIGQALELMDSDTVVIPGHGPLSNRAELFAYRDRLAQMLEAVRPMFEDGTKLEDAVASKPLQAFATGEGGFINQDQFVQFIYASLEAPEESE